MLRQYAAGPYLGEELEVVFRFPGCLIAMTQFYSHDYRVQTSFPAFSFLCEISVLHHSH
jgi:hypothetical protein